MEFKVLGSLQAHVSGTDVVPTAGKVRQMLAMLVLHPGQVVTVGALMDEIWDEPPRSAPSTLQTYVLQLRRLLRAAVPDGGRDARQLLVTRHQGYQLDISPETVDVVAFETQAAAGRAALHAGDVAMASQLLSGALALWRGPALVDVPRGRRLDIEAMRLEEHRLGAVECRIDADLRLGRDHELLSELAVLAVHHPLNENLHAEYMVALYRANRQWQALDVYARLLGQLREELGVNPSPRLRELHAAILDSDPALDEFGTSARDVVLRRVG